MLISAHHSSVTLLHLTSVSQLLRLLTSISSIRLLQLLVVVAPPIHLRLLDRHAGVLLVTVGKLLLLTLAVSSDVVFLETALISMLLVLRRVAVLAGSVSDVVALRAVLHVVKAVFDVITGALAVFSLRLAVSVSSTTVTTFNLPVAI